MSYSWSFYSFSPDLFERYLGGDCPELESILESALTWDTGYWQDDQAPSALAKYLANYGFAYDRLDEKQSAVLDEVLSLVLAPEALGPSVEMVPESPDLLFPAVVQQLVSAASDHGSQVRLLDLLRRGRRRGASSPSECGYCILSREQVGELAAEVRSVLDLPIAWSESYVPEDARGCLLGPLESAIGKNRPLIAFLG